MQVNAGKCWRSEEERADSLGLVSGHAYAILEVEEYEGTKLLMVKNPWGHKSFSGKFSVNDTKSWTPRLKAHFGHDKLAKNDMGIFWIDIDTFCDVFENLYINWNPDLLKYRKSFYDLWKCADMCQADYISVKQNPQYML